MTRLGLKSSLAFVTFLLGMWASPSCQAGLLQASFESADVDATFSATFAATSRSNPFAGDEIEQVSDAPVSDMSAETSNSVSSSLAAAGNSGPQFTHLNVSDRLVLTENIWLRPPFSLGVFRPPRTVTC